MRFDQVKFGHRIKHLQKKRNLTQEQLATALHISTDHLSKIELGKPFRHDPICLQWYFCIATDTSNWCSIAEA